jgi:hypothetical protein
LAPRGRLTGFRFRGSARAARLHASTERIHEVDHSRRLVTLRSLDWLAFLLLFEQVFQVCSSSANNLAEAFLLRHLLIYDPAGHPVLPENYIRA